MAHIPTPNTNKVQNPASFGRAAHRQGRGRRSLRADLASQAAVLGWPLEPGFRDIVPVK